MSRVKVLLALLALLGLTGGIHRRPIAAAAGGGGGPLTIVQTKPVSAAAADNGSLTFDSNVTSGNVIVCMVASANATSSASTISKSSGTATIGTLSSRCDASGASFCNVEIYSAPVTGTGTLTMAYNWTGTTTDGSSMDCIELSGYAAVNGFAADVDADSPQHEVITVTAGSYVFGAQCDWGADADAPDFVNAPVHTQIQLYQTANYAVVYYRSSTTLTGSNDFGMDGNWFSGQVDQCLAEVTPGA